MSQQEVSSQSGHGPLAGTKVLDFSSYLAGPNCCSQLADFGAEVIKIEGPGGDVVRGYPTSIPGESRPFLGWNRGKLGVVVDLKHASGKEIVRRMAQTADVLVENFRPGVMDRLGLGYDELRKINPRLVYCGIRGYGDTGPLAHRPGYDSLLQSLTGMAQFQGASTESEPQLAAGYMVDYYGAAMAALGIVSALHHRNRTGEGQYITTSLLAAAIGMQSARFVWADGEPKDTKRETEPGRILGIYAAKSGYLVVSANTEKFWRNLCEALDLRHFAQDERFNTVKKRAAAADEIVPQLRAAFQKHTALEWDEIMAGKVPCAAIRSINDLFENPQVVEVGLVRHVDHSRIGGYRTTGPAVRFSATPIPELRGAPMLGEHTRSVLASYGWTEAQIDELFEQGVVA